MSIIGEHAIRSIYFLVMRAFCFSILGGLTSSVLAQDVRIVVLNSRNLGPVANECLNISLGKWHGGDLIVPTDRAGVVTLHIDGNMASVETGSSTACNGTAVGGPRPFAEGQLNISIEPDYYVSCQEYGRPTHGEPLTRDTLPNMIPSYPIHTIRDSGIFAGNSCSGLRAKAKPGELVLFVRPMHWWEKAKQ